MSTRPRRRCARARTGGAAEEDSRRGADADTDMNEEEVEDEDGWTSYCVGCLVRGDDGGGHRWISCDGGCRRWMHVECVLPNLPSTEAIPTHWVCSECAAGGASAAQNRRKTSNTKKRKCTPMCPGCDRGLGCHAGFYGDADGLCDDDHERVVHFVIADARRQQQFRVCPPPGTTLRLPLPWRGWRDCVIRGCHTDALDLQYGGAEHGNICTVRMRYSERPEWVSRYFVAKPLSEAEWSSWSSHCGCEWGPKQLRFESERARPVLRRKGLIPNAPARPNAQSMRQEAARPRQNCSIC